MSHFHAHTWLKLQALIAHQTKHVMYEKGMKCCQPRTKSTVHSSFSKSPRWPLHYRQRACWCVPWFANLLVMLHGSSWQPISRVGQNRIYTPYMTVYLVISLPKIPYIHRIYMVLANPTYIPTATLPFLPLASSQLKARHFSQMMTDKSWNNPRLVTSHVVNCFL